MRSNVSRLFAITGKCSFASFDISKGWLYRTYVTLENGTFSICKKTLVEINVSCFVTTSFNIKSKTYLCKQREKKQRVGKITYPEASFCSNYGESVHAPFVVRFIRSFIIRSSYAIQYCKVATYPQMFS